MAKRKWTKEEILEWRRDNQQTLYFNKEDSNIFVPKAIGIGFSFNFANPLAYVTIVVIVAIILIIRFIVKR